MRTLQAKCEICNTPITVNLCCDGHECGCRGLPIEPPICSEECYDKLMDNINSKKTPNQ